MKIFGTHLFVVALVVVVLLFSSSSFLFQTNPIKRINTGIIVVDEDEVESNLLLENAHVETNIVDDKTEEIDEDDKKKSDPKNKDTRAKDTSTKDTSTKDPSTKDPSTKDPSTKDPENKTKDDQNKDTKTKNARNKNTKPKNARNKNTKTKDVAKEVDSKDQDSKDVDSEDANDENSNDKDSKDKDYDSKDKDSKDKDSKDKDSKGKASKGKSSKDKASKDKDSKDKDSKDKDSKDKDLKDKDSKDKDSKDKDSKDKDSKDKDSKDKDSKDTDTDSDSKDKDSKDKVSKDKDSKDTDDGDTEDNTIIDSSTTDQKSEKTIKPYKKCLIIGSSGIFRIYPMEKEKYEKGNYLWIRVNFPDLIAKFAGTKKNVQCTSFGAYVPQCFAAETPNCPKYDHHVYFENHRLRKNEEPALQYVKKTQNATIVSFAEVKRITAARNKVTNRLLKTRRRFISTGVLCTHHFLDLCENIAVEGFYPFSRCNGKRLRYHYYSNENQYKRITGCVSCQTDFAYMYHLSLKYNFSMNIYPMCEESNNWLTKASVVWKRDEERKAYISEKLKAKKKITEETPIPTPTEILETLIPVSTEIVQDSETPTPTEENYIATKILDGPKKQTIKRSQPHILSTLFYYVLRIFSSHE